MDNDHCIFLFDDFISKEKCDEIIDRFENDPEKKVAVISTCDKDGNEIAVVNGDRKSGREIIIHPDHENWSDVYLLIIEMFAKKVSMQVIETFCKHFEKYGENQDDIKEIWFRNGVPFPGPAMSLNCTNPNSEYKWHNDSGRPEILFTGLLYLNDIDPNDGGATEFLHGMKIQPKAGRLLLFPAVWSAAHRGSYVRVNKYAIAFAVAMVPESYIQETYFTST